MKSYVTNNKFPLDTLAEKSNANWSKSSQIKVVLLNSGRSVSWGLETLESISDESLSLSSLNFCGRSIEICIGLSGKHGCRMYNDVDEEITHSRFFFIFSFLRYLEGINEYRSSVMFFSPFFPPFFFFILALLSHISRCM